MKLVVRRIGNSLGVIIPKRTLEAWGVDEGGELELTERGIRPLVHGGFSQQALDELKRSIALAVLRSFTLGQIRAQILANLHRWKQQGAWVPDYAKWERLAQRADDGALLAAMLGRDEVATRLRQSMPFVGLLSQKDVRKLHEEAAS